MSTGGNSSSTYDAKSLGQDIGGQLQSAIDTPYSVGSTTTNAQNQILSNAQNPAYASATNNAIKTTNDLISSGGLTSGQQADNAATNGYATDYAALADAYAQGTPGYDQVRNKLINDTQTSNFNAFNNSGLFGSDNNQYSANLGLADALGAFDMAAYDKNIANQYASLQGQQGATQAAFDQSQTGVTNQANANNSLSSLYAAMMAPSYDALAVGGMQDSAAQTDWNTLLQAAGVLNQSSSTDTSGLSADAAWWQQALGAASTAAGIAGSFM